MCVLGNEKNVLHIELFYLLYSKSSGPRRHKKRLLPSEKSCCMVVEAGKKSRTDLICFR